MSQYCEFSGLNKGDACVVCGAALPRDFEIMPVRVCDVPCPHLGPQRFYKSGPQANQPVTVEVTCDTCGGKRKQVAQPVFSCDLFGRCLPTYRPSLELRQQYESRPDAIRLCDGCGRGVESGA